MGSGSGGQKQGALGRVARRSYRFLVISSFGPAQDVSTFQGLGGNKAVSGRLSIIASIRSETTLPWPAF
jgi:hypothetical protein